MAKDTPPFLRAGGNLFRVEGLDGDVHGIAELRSLFAERGNLGDCLRDLFGRDLDAILRIKGGGNHIRTVGHGEDVREVLSCLGDDGCDADSFSRCGRRRRYGFGCHFLFAFFCLPFIRQRQITPLAHKNQQVFSKR